MSTTRLASAAGRVPRFQSALRKLANEGVQALKPQFVVPTQDSGAINPIPGRWQSARVSKRVANLIRKQAILGGTYGSFDSESKIGWDPAWDVELAVSSPRGQGRQPQQVAPKGTSRDRTREQRAIKIESKMEGMDERIEAYYEEKHKSKPARTFENHFKALSRVRK